MASKILIPLFVEPSAPYISDKLQKENPTVVHLKEDDAALMAAIAGQFLAACDAIITIPRNIAVSKSVAGWSKKAKDNPSGPVTDFVGSGSTGEAIGGLAAIMTLCFALCMASSKSESLEKERTARIGARYQEIYNRDQGKLPKEEGEQVAEEEGIEGKEQVAEEEGIEGKEQVTEKEGIELELPEKYKEKYAKKYKSKPRFIQSPHDHSKFFLLLEPNESYVPEEEKETPKSPWTPFVDSIKKVDAVIARPISFLDTTFSLSSMLYWVVWYMIPTFVTANQGTVGVIIGTGLLGTALSTGFGFVLPALIGLAFLSRVIFNSYVKKKDLSVSEQKSLGFISKFFFEPFPAFKNPIYNILFHLVTLGSVYFSRTIIGGVFCIFSRMGYALVNIEAIKVWIWKKSKEHKKDEVGKGTEVQLFVPKSEGKTLVQETTIVADKSLVEDSLDILKEIMVSEQDNLIKLDMESATGRLTPLSLASDVDFAEFPSVEELKEGDPEKLKIRAELGLDRLSPSLLGWIGIILGAFLGGWISTHNNAQFSEWFASDFSSALHISSTGIPSSWSGAMSFIGIFIFVAAVVYGIRSLVIKTSHVQKAKEDLLNLEKSELTLDEIYNKVHQFKQYKKFVEGKQESIRKQIEEENRKIDQRNLPEYINKMGFGRSFFAALWYFFEDPKEKRISEDDYLQMPKALSDKINRIITPTDFRSKFERFFGYFFLGILGVEGAFFVWRVLSVGGGVTIFGTIFPPSLAIWLGVGLALGVIYATLKLWNYARDQEANKAAAIVSEPNAFIKYVGDTQNLLKAYHDNLDIRAGARVTKKAEEEEIPVEKQELSDQEREERGLSVSTPKGVLAATLKQVFHPPKPSGASQISTTSLSEFPTKVEGEDGEEGEGEGEKPSRPS